jgi:hypothetical protein
MNKVKSGFWLLLMSFIFASMSVFAGPIDDVVAAFKKGDASALTKLMDNTVEIKMTGKSNSYSKAQAEIILKDFFAKNTVKSFDEIHKGGNSNSAEFGVYKMVTSGGTYRTSVFLQKKGATLVLNEIRIENQ